MEYKELVDKLVHLGFSSYEARAYIALLRRHPVTGYELAKSSGIPPSKIYEVIAKLLSRAVISPLSGKPAKYIPQDNRVFLKNLQASFGEAIAYLENHLPSLGDIDVDYVWNVNDAEAIMTMARDMVSRATRNVILLGWDSELREILPCLKNGGKKRKIAIIQFGAMAVDTGVVYNHGVEKVLKREKGGRMFSLVTDQSSLLQGIFFENRTVRGIYTSHPSLVEMAIDHMVHEIYTTKMYDAFPREMDTKFGGKNLRALRDIWKR